MGLTQTSFSRVAGVKVRTLSKLEKGEPPSDAVRRKLTEVRRFRGALVKVVRPEAIGPWLTRPNGAFENLTPVEVIERGEIDRLWAMIHDLRSGNPV